MPKIHQLLAAEKSVKTRHNKIIDDSYKSLQKGELVAGSLRTYEPLDEENGEKLPAEHKIVQLKADEALRQIATSFTDLWDLTATREYANTQAKANITLDGQTFIQDAPVTYLVWLEKQLTDVLTVLGKLPILPPEHDWEFDAHRGHYATEPKRTHRTKKVPKVLTKAPATDKHPAQTEVYNDDELVGYWNLVNFSGALPKPVVGAMIERATKLLAAVKMARSAANETDAPQVNVGETIFAYLLKPLDQIN